MAIIVGDIHGNVEKVKAFLDYKPEDEHIALGDYVDSFFEPQVRQLEALQLLLDSKAVLLWGNHDLHYLLKPPFVCTGFQHYKEKPLQEIIETNKHRFLAAYVADGWLLSHAGVHSSFFHRVKDDDLNLLIDKLNSAMCRMLDKMNRKHPLFAVSSARGGASRAGGVFWYDFKRESGLAPVKQIFGHTETPEPVIAENYVALDTTNTKGVCWLYDTAINDLVRIETKRQCDFSILPPTGLW